MVLGTELTKLCCY